MKNTKKTVPANRKHEILALFLGNDYQQFEAKEFINQALFLAGLIVFASLLS